MIINKINISTLNLHCLFFFLLVILLSCQQKIIFKERREILDGTWNTENKQLFITEITDTLSPCNVYFYFTHTDNYQFSNIWLFLTITNPQNYHIKDTVEFSLVDDYGKWEGIQYGTLIIHAFPLKSNVVFPKYGKYELKFEQAMRKTELPEVREIGIMIEKL
ncbi:MAG: gliding motility lipoprotein GldH [Bacteroidia bacterium]|nr:gliding motility lipoprotein GldH [Bacteroidia bacterium]